ncbi:hypothetical protein [Agromyces marinus]|uniref:Uncharacterized protein n=1 Tax=Agromyces marinus TaxID=1389020 RepID=A0ABM8GX77_9MICO|nr:hypothetical protein [Agromyces marinus]UIP58648.1 hypothetical protein DSM26151_15270 [Agromyces marinus]BDZ53066.1 hypothetical protein GCM10025870_01390 [Agromyces marinus]
MGIVELLQARELAAGDTLVSASGGSYEVTKVSRVGRGIRVQYLTEAGRAGRFTAAPESVIRARRAPGAHAA